ncbi:MAG TPA: phosphoribosyltransferase family protein [Terriglobia bacterium]
MFTEQQIRRRIRQLAREINQAYEGKTLHIVGASDDCFLFMADLIRALRVPMVCHFMSTLIRATSVEGVPVQEIFYMPALNLTDKDVLLLSGIVYSGVTLDFLCRQILAKGPKSLGTASLVEKPEDRKVDVVMDYLAFKSTSTGGQFLVGYGLGHRGLYRNLRCIAALSSA